jgi:hypothetical protein
MTQTRAVAVPNGSAGRIAGLIILMGCGTALCGAAPSEAQAPTRADSLELELRRLRARMDSLELLVARLAAAGRDTVPATDELAALRAAARAAGEPVTPRTGDAPPPAGGTNLNRLNPEISATGDVRFQMDPDAADQDNVEVREFEFSFQSALDPYAATKIFVAASAEGVEVEEGYAYWSGIPGGVRLDVGRFRQQIGELNRWHPHALPESEFPLVLREYLGDEGLRGDGLGLYWVLPFGGGAAGTWELWAQGTLADNEVLFGGGRHLSGLGHVNAFWELSPAVFVQLGGSLLAGSNPDSSLASRVVGADFRISWRPPARALYRSFTLRGEGYLNRRAVGGTVEYFSGAYVSLQYQLSRRLFAGARVDAVEPLAVPDGRTWAVVPALTWWQSEWVYLRLEGQHVRDALAGGGHDVTNRLVLQAVWAIGPHKHETY